MIKVRTHRDDPVPMLWADTHRHRALCMVHPMKALGMSLRVVDDGWAALREFKTDPDRYLIAVLHVALTGLGSRELSRQLRRHRPAMPLLFVGIPSWPLGEHDRALPLPLSPLQLHHDLVQLGVIGPGQRRPDFALTG